MTKDTTRTPLKRQELERCRKAIDEIDAKIVSLLSKRIEHAAEAGRIKEKNGFPPLDPVREAEVLERVVAIAGGRLDGLQLRRIYTRIIEASRSVQQMPEVDFSGLPSCRQAGTKSAGGAK
ncbi:MAG TPA: hypothetical protein ENN79_01885 [Desulfobacteraceae bacterium]|nr:hypothetical protein [Desulfobacteraceae bacterium]